MIDLALWSQGLSVQTYITTSPHFQKELLDRITSYNVCYTKLLRSCGIILQQSVASTSF